MGVGDDDGDGDDDLRTLATMGDASNSNLFSPIMNITHKSYLIVKIFEIAGRGLIAGMNFAGAVCTLQTCRG